MTTLRRVCAALSEITSRRELDRVLERVVKPLIGANHAEILEPRELSREGGSPAARAALCDGAPRWLAGSGVGAAAILPLRVGGVLVGVLELGFDAPLRDARGREQIADLAQQIALAVDRARLIEQALAGSLDAEEQRNRFLAMIGHELRNPLAAIRSAADLLAMLDGGPELARVSATLERQSGHMARMIDDLLDVSAIIRGQLAIDRSPVDLAKLVRAEIAELEVSVARAGLRLLLQIGGEPLPLLGDELRLAHVIHSLVGNALKFTPPPGTITVSAYRRDDAVRLVVADSGVGIDDDLLAQIFEPGSQAAQKLARSSGGLGIGLAVVAGIVERHGGHIAAESPGLGWGATFTVSLPAAPAPHVSAEPARRGAVPPGRVLVVEDNIDAAELLCAILERAGHQVEMARDGQHALEAVRQRRPDVIICDIGLPGELSGYEIAEAVRADPALAGITLIALSGYGSPADVELARRTGFDVHLTKPTNLAAIERAIARRRR